MQISSPEVFKRRAHETISELRTFSRRRVQKKLQERVFASDAVKKMEKVSNKMEQDIMKTVKTVY